MSVQVKDIPLDKIQATGYRQAILGLIAGYGTVTIQSAGLTADERLEGVVRPKEFRDAVLSRVGPSRANP